MAAEFYYTDSFDSPGSDVVASVYYNSRTFELFVVTNRDDAYGYKNVPVYTFNHFKNARSKGHFWNTAVKGTYSNFSRGVDVDFINGAARVALAVPAAAKPADKTEYDVIVKVDGQLTISGEADSIEDALKKANEVLSETFKGSAKIEKVEVKFV